MQIELNKIRFDVKPVEAPLRAALLADPVIARGASRPVWAWNHEEGKGGYLVPTTADKAIPLPTGLTVFVPKPGTAGTVPQKAEGPTAKMGERFLAALNAKDWSQVLQPLARITGVPQRKVPLETYAALKPLGSFHLRMEMDFQVVELSHAGRNLAAFLFLPGIVGFQPFLKAAPAEGTVLPPIARQLFVIPPATQAALSLRRLAVARRLSEMQAELGGTKPADLPQDDPRRATVTKLGAEWKVLQQPAKAPTKAA